MTSPILPVPPSSSIDLDLVWLCRVSSLDRTPCDMLIGLARPKKVYRTVKSSYACEAGTTYQERSGGHCETKCLRSLSQAKLNRVSFHFNSKLSNLAVIITEENNFNTCYPRSKLHTQRKNQGFAYLSLWQQLL